MKVSLGVLISMFLLLGRVGAQVGEPLPALAPLLEKQHPGTLVWLWSACRDTEDRDVVYLLAIGHGSDAASLLTVRMSDGVLLNGADLELRGRKVKVGETMGGLWTIARTQSVSDFLITKTFTAGPGLPSHTDLRKAIPCPKHDEGKYGPSSTR